MTTVTTDIEQIKQLFAEAVARTTKLAADIDGQEGQLLNDARKFFETAIAAVVPVLKYVDQLVPEVTDGYNHPVRGIMLLEEFKLVLLRNGQLQSKSSSTGFDPCNLSFGDKSNSERVDVLIGMISVLGVKFSEALAKADERRAKIAQRSDQLAQAAKAFQA